MWATRWLGSRLRVKEWVSEVRLSPAPSPSHQRLHLDDKTAIGGPAL